MKYVIGPVIVYDRFGSAPVFHLPGWMDQRKGRDHWETGERVDGLKFERTTTVCGRTLYRWEWKGTEAGREKSPSSNLMRWDHAAAVGRLCSQCARHGPA